MEHELAGHLTEHPALTDQADAEKGDLVTIQVDITAGRLVSDQAQQLQSLTERQWKIVMFCDVPRSVAAMRDELGLTHRTFFRRNHLEPLPRGGVLRMTHPDQPNHPDQAYVLTEDGAKLKARYMNEETGEENGD